MQTKKVNSKNTKNTKLVKTAKKNTKKTAKQIKQIKEVEQTTTIKGKKHKEKSKFRIMQSASELFAKQGFDSTSIREICSDADANVCMVSYFWGGKKALYNGIIQDLVDKQALYAKKNMNLNIDPKKLSKQDQTELLYNTADKIIDFIYGSWISDDMFRFLLQEQQNKRVELESPVYHYLRRVVASVLDKKINDREVILKTSFIVSQIISAKILPVFSLDLLNQKEFTGKDIKIVKDNVNLYLKSLIKENTSKK